MEKQYRPKKRERQKPVAYLRNMGDNPNFRDRVIYLVNGRGESAITKSEAEELIRDLNECLAKLNK